MVLLGVTLIGFIAFRSIVMVVPHKYTMIIERLGKFRCQCKPGMYLMIPWVDVIRKIDWCYNEVDCRNDCIRTRQVHINSMLVNLKELILDFGEQPVITKDLAQVQIDAVLYYRISDPKLAVLRIVNLPYQLELLT